MRPILLVAQREYVENAKTKGFWIGIFLLPVMLVGSIFVQVALEKSTPTRHFVVVDRSGTFEPVVERALERLHQRDVLRALGEYVREHLAEDAPRVDLERAPADGGASLLADLERRNPEAVTRFVESGGVEVALAQLEGRLDPERPPFQEPRRRFLRAELPPDVDADAPLDELASQLRPFLRGDREIEVAGERTELFAALLVPADAVEQASSPGLPAAPGERTGAQYWSSNLADEDLREELESVLNEELRRRSYIERGVDPGTVEEVAGTSLPVASLDPRKEEGSEEVSVADVIRQWAPVGFVYLLWISIFTVSQMLLNNTIEEKSNRIIEVLLSSVTAGELMLGKLLGIAGIGLTMLGAWIGSLVVVLAIQQGPGAEFATQLFLVLRTSGLLPAFAAYFLLGYLLYSGVFLAIGSVCNTLKEAQNMMGPVMLVMVVPLFTMMFIPKDPNGTLATILSWIPLYTPFVMMNRFAADPPLFDVIGTGLLLLVSTGLVLWLSGRVFRAGVLRTGQPPKFLELLGWMRS